MYTCQKLKSDMLLLTIMLLLICAYSPVHLRTDAEIGILYYSGQDAYVKFSSSETATHTCTVLCHSSGKENDKNPTSVAVESPMLTIICLCTKASIKRVSLYSAQCELQRTTFKYSSNLGNCCTSTSYKSPTVLPTYIFFLIRLIFRTKIIGDANLSSLEVCQKHPSVKVVFR